MTEEKQDMQKQKSNCATIQMQKLIEIFLLFFLME